MDSDVCRWTGEEVRNDERLGDSMVVSECIYMYLGEGALE